MHMPDAERCLAMADEADRLAEIVSYGRDKTRLKQQAESWREKARVLEAEQAAPPAGHDADTFPNGIMGWLRRRHA